MLFIKVAEWAAGGGSLLGCLRPQSPSAAAAAPGRVPTDLPFPDGPENGTGQSVYFKQP